MPKVVEVQAVPVSEDRLMLGGYVPVPRAVRGDWQSGLVPERYISVSECLTGGHRGPEFWAWHTNPAGARRCDGPLLAIGFTSGDAAALVEEINSHFRFSARDAVEQGVPEGIELLVAEIPMPDGAQVRGFEVIGVEIALTSVHSWLCHGNETELTSPRSRTRRRRRRMMWEVQARERTRP